CVNAPEWAQGLPCFEGVEGSVRVAYALGSTSGTTASEWLALGTLPEGTPMELSILTQDEKGRTLELADFVSTYIPGVTGLGSLVPMTRGSTPSTSPCGRPWPARSPASSSPACRRAARRSRRSLNGEPRSARARKTT